MGNGTYQWLPSSQHCSLYKSNKLNFSCHSSIKFGWALTAYNLPLNISELSRKLGPFNMILVAHNTLGGVGYLATTLVRH